MQLFVAFFLGFCFLIFCTFPFAVITRLKLVLLRLLVLVFLSCNIIYLFHFGCIACALCRHHHIVVVIIMETRVCQPRHGGSAWVFSHDASGSQLQQEKNRGGKLWKAFGAYQLLLLLHLALLVACGTYDIRFGYGSFWLALLFGNFRLLTRKRRNTLVKLSQSLSVCACCSLICRT